VGEGGDSGLKINGMGKLTGKLKLRDLRRSAKKINIRRY